MSYSLYTHTEQAKRCGNQDNAFYSPPSAVSHAAREGQAVRRGICFRTMHSVDWLVAGASVSILACTNLPYAGVD